jgi:glycosyltransferase involved in cell wall biosynthesis
MLPGDDGGITITQGAGTDRILQKSGASSFEAYVSVNRSGQSGQYRQLTECFDVDAQEPQEVSGTKMPTELIRPLVSVIIPTFNRPQYLGLALASAINQTFKNIEIIVQDNGSSEDPADSVSAFADSRVKFFRNASNIGQTANIVTACARATGKYLAILGDDDLWSPDFLGSLVPPLESDPEIIVSFCAHDYIDVHGRLNAPRTAAINRRHRHGLHQGVHGPFVRIALVNRAVCAVSAAVFRREALDWSAIPLDLAYGCDNYINYLAARTGKRCFYQPEHLAQLRLLPQSASVTATATCHGREMTGRASLLCWDTFYRDSAVADGRRYFAMKRADNALRVIFCLLRQRGLRPVLRELKSYLQCGVIRPSALLYHFRYGRH